MEITSAEFVKGIVLGDTNYDTQLPQVVLYGRSNAGKSTLVNTLTKRNALARISNTPGRTKQANLFLINKNWHLIDMPGFGYAKASHTDRETIQRLVQWFITEAPAVTRKSILIVDSKIGLTDLDREMLHQLIEQDESIIILLNKIDRLNQSDVAKTKNALLKEIPETIPVVLASTKTGKGIHGLLDLIQGKN